MGNLRSLFCAFLLFSVALGHAYARPEPQVKPDVKTGLHNKAKQEKGEEERPQARELSIIIGNCFPGDATVHLQDGSLKTMAELRVGDVVATADASGRVIFEPVYFFGHRRAQVVEPFLRVNVTGMSSSYIELTPGHFVHSNEPGAHADWAERKTVAAHSLAPGSTLWLLRGPALESGRVSSVEIVYKQGAFDPYTLGGNVIVNGVLASCHHNWILDSFVPPKLVHHVPFVYQTLLYPLRALYQLFGPLFLQALREKATLVKKSSSVGYLSQLVASNVQQKFEL